MALAVNAIDRRGPSNEMHCQLQLKKYKITLYYPFIYVTAKDVLPARRSASVLSGCVVRVENGETYHQL